MKKVFKFMMMALAAIVMSVSFAACSSDDDDTPETPKKSNTLYRQIIDLSFSEDLQTLFHQGIEVTIVQGDSTQTWSHAQGTDVKNGHFKQALSYMDIPVVYSYYLKFNYYDQEKIAELPEKDSYDLTWTDNSIIWCEKSDGSSWADTIKTTYGKTGVKRSEIDSYIRENFYQKTARVNIADIIKKHEQK